MNTKITLTQNADGTDNVEVVKDDMTLHITGATVAVMPYVPPVVILPPAPPAPPPAPPRVISQELIPSKYTVMVGETFTTEGRLLLDDKTSKPVTAYSYGWDHALLSSPNTWTSQFTALAPGVAKIVNDNSATTGRTSVTIIPNDGTKFPPPVVKPPAPAPAPAPAPTPAPVSTTPPPLKGVDTGSHMVTFETVDAAGRVWTAKANVGDDNTTPAQYMSLLDKDGNAHPGITAWFYANCVKVGACRADNRYGYLGFKSIKVTYNGVEVPFAKSSHADGTYDFTRGNQLPPCRYGVQTRWDAKPLDRSLLPTYTKDKQRTTDDSKADYTANGPGICGTWDMGAHGERSDIGYMAGWYMPFITDPSDANWAVVQRADGNSGNWGVVCICDPATGKIVDTRKYPNATMMPPAQIRDARNPIAQYGGSYRGDVLTPPKSLWANGESPYTINGAHLTSYALLSAIVTGDAADRDLASFWANFTMLELNPAYALDQGCILGPQRRAAWCMRSLFIAAYASSDCDYFKAELMRNIAISDAYPKNEFGIFDRAIVYPGVGEAFKYSGMALWMCSYMSMSWEPIARKIPEAVSFAQYLGKLDVTYSQFACYMARTNYVFICYDPAGKLMTDFGEMIKLSLCTCGYELADAEAMVAAKTVDAAYAVQVKDSARRNRPPNKFANGVADFFGYTYAPDSYPAGTIAAVTAAANCHTPGIEKALAYVQNVPTKPDYVGMNDQKYHLDLLVTA